MAANPSPIVETQSKPLKGKYDGRGKYKRTKAHRKSCSKPVWEKHLSRNGAAKVFRALNVQDKMLELLSTTDQRLKFEVLKYVWDRLEGKPFVAINPNENKQPATLHQDNRLQVAIQSLVVTGKKVKGKKAKVIEALGQSAGDPQLISGECATQYPDPSASSSDTAEVGINGITE